MDLCCMKRDTEQSSFLRFINADTLASLQIMQSESHPNSHNQGPTKSNSGAKEGLSVYGLFHHLARTTQGKYLLRQCFYRPSLSRTVIHGRLDAVAVFVRPENSAIIKALVQNLVPIVNARTLLINLRKGVSSGSGKAGSIAKSIWSGLRKFTFHTIGIRKDFAQLVGADRLPIWTQIRDEFDTHQLAQVGTMIHEVVDFEESLVQQRTIVKPGIDESLDERKRVFAGIDELLSEAARSIASEVPEGLSDDLNVIYFPQIGFLIAMPKDRELGRAFWEGPEDDAWQQMFSTDDITYYKNSQMQQMDDHFGDIYSNICG